MPNPPRPSHKAQLLIDANRESPLVYQSCDEHGCTFRLADDRVFILNAADCVSLGEWLPSWRHLEERAA